MAGFIAATYLFCFSFLHHELPLHMNTSVWIAVEQAERERKGGLFSNTGIATAFTQNEAHEKGRRPPPALPVTLTPDTVPLVSQRAVDAIAVVFGFGCILDLFLFIYLFLARCGVSPVTQTWWKQPWKVAYAETFFVGSTDSNARLSFRLQAKGKELLYHSSQLFCALSAGWC